MREPERRADVGAELTERSCAELAVTRGIAANVISLRPDVDGQLERRRDGAGDHVGRSAGVGGRDLDGWRDDVGILGDWQECRGGKSEHHDEDIDDRSEPRVIDEEVREFHDLPQPWLWSDPKWIDPSC